MREDIVDYHPVYVGILKKNAASYAADIIEKLMLHRTH